MPSPFPGMDPYLEDPSVWEEFHHIFITESMYFLSDRLPDSYIAKIDERVELISRDDEATAQYVPDVAVARGPGSAAPATNEIGGAAIAAAPITIPSADAMEVREAYVEILRLPDMKLITSIELLSPWNKFGEGIGEYRHKRRALVRQGVHVVEIDLLRRSRRTELAQPLPTGDYFAFIFRGDRRPDVDVYAWGIRQPLPTIPIPLAPPDPDIALDLATLVNTAYDRGKYTRKLRYTHGPPPEPLTAADAAWAAENAKRSSAAPK
jgi:Protein of unknown function (DUF4058)